ncbi:biotin synthase BioB, partial [Streptomyces sp. NPDC000987]
SMQPLGLYIANSIFLGDYLTSEGQAGKADLDMIADAGFEVEGADVTTLPEHRGDVASCGPPGAGGCGPRGSHLGDSDGGDIPVVAAATRQTPPSQARTGLVTVRRRGAGTDRPPNA